MKDLCRFIGEKEFSSLATVVSLQKIKCQKKTVLISKFCYTKFKNNQRYTRGLFDRKKGMAYCEEADRVYIKYRCRKFTKNHLCDDKKITCDFMRSEFARNHQNIKMSMTNTEVSNEYDISCHFIRGDWSAE